MARNMNALWNCRNPYQGTMKRVLCVCSAGLLRSPTIAWVLGNKGFNTRAAGVYDYALVEADEVLNEWADIIVFAEQEHHDYYINKFTIEKPLYVLDLPDKYGFREETLVEMIEEALIEKGFPNGG